MTQSRSTITWVLLATAIIGVGLHLRSLSHHDLLFVFLGSGRVQQVAVADGQLAIAVSNLRFGSDHSYRLLLHMDRYDDLAITSEELRDEVHMRVELLGFGLAAGQVSSWLAGSRDAWSAAAMVPGWILWALPLALAGMRVVRSYRGKRSRQRGLCPHCGYDLRATPERCPECGWSVGEAKLGET